MVIGVTIGYVYGSLTVTTLTLGIDTLSDEGLNDYWTTLVPTNQFCLIHPLSIYGLVVFEAQ